MRNFLKLGALIATVAFGGMLYAQDQGGEPGEPATDAPIEPTPDATLTGQQQAQLDPTEMRQEANKLLNGMLDSLKDVVEVQKIARKQKDVIKLNCVNDKLLQVKQLLNISETANTNMAEAIAQTDETERYHQYGKIVIASEQVTGLVEEAKNCIGEELIYIGPLNIDVDAPDVETPDDSAFPDVDIEPPAYASPFA